MKRILLSAAVALATGFVACSAFAQGYRDSAGTPVNGVVPLVGCSGLGVCTGPVTSTNPLPVSGTFSASLSGFQPTPAYATPLAVGATSSRVALPSGTVVVVYNTGSSAAYVTLGNSSIAATASDDVIQPLSWLAFTVGTNTYIAAITTTGPTSLNISGGSGLPTGAGGGSGGGGGSNASVGPIGSAIPTSGTFAAMTVGGNLTGLAGTANGLLVDGSAVTQPVSAASLPLPSGAATAANQTAVQSTVGTGATTALTVQGNPAGAAVPVSTAALPLPSGAATAANQTAVQGATGSAVPSNAQLLGANSGGNLTGLIQAGASVPINISTATTTQLIALSGSTKIYVTAWDVVASGAGNITLEYGAGTNCSAGTTPLTGTYSFAAQSGISRGGGLGPILIVPAGNALCALTSAAVQMSGSVSYTQF